MQGYLGTDLIDRTAHSAKNAVIYAIDKAADKIGIDFDYLLQNAQQESSLKPTAKSKTSSATGLFQFIEQTWLAMIKKHGDKHGLSHLADKITERNNGSFAVNNPSARQMILNLRKNPEIASLMAAEFTNENKTILEKSTKANIGHTELYLAHFLGAGGASKFINKMMMNGEQKAATLFPEAAQANKAVFYNKNGSARSLSDVYALFDQKFDSNGQNTGTAFAKLDHNSNANDQRTYKHFLSGIHSPSPSQMVDTTLPEAIVMSQSPLRFAPHFDSMAVTTPPLKVASDNDGFGPLLDHKNFDDFKIFHPTDILLMTAEWRNHTTEESDDVKAPDLNAYFA